MRAKRQYLLLPLCLLALYLTYQAGIMAFAHFHVVNGVMLVHSHPSSDHQHTHTTEQAIIIAQQSHVQTLEAELPSHVEAYLPVVRVLEFQIPVFHLKAPHTHCVQLRAPPAC